MQWRTSDNDNGTSPPARKEPATTARRLPLSPLCIVIRSPLLIAGFTFIYLFGAKVGIGGEPVSRDRQEVGVDRLGRLARGLRSRLREIWPSQTLLRHLRLAATLPIIGGCITVPNGECVRI